MLYYDGIHVSEGIGVNKTSAFKECITCINWYFIDKIFTFQTTVCNNCQDVLIMFVDINSIAILNIYDIDYRCIIVGITKSEAIVLLRNADFSEKTGSF